MYHHADTLTAKFLWASGVVLLFAAGSYWAQAEDGASGKNDAADGAIADSAIADSAIADSAIADGAIAGGAIADGAIARGAVADAPAVIPDSKQAGGESEGIVQVANLIYAGTKSSKCFADHFLVQAEKDSSISTSRRFHAVKLASEDVYGFPMLIMTGEGAFTLRDEERENLRKFVERGGFLLASAGCSSQEWDRSFRSEIATVFPDQKLAEISLGHAVFNTVYEIKTLTTSHGKPKPLEGVSIGGRLGVLYSQDGLNDTAHTQGCCCCGGNEISNAIQVNVNILAYALTH